MNFPFLSTGIPVRELEYLGHLVGNKYERFTGSLQFPDDAE
jgi:hypothetical protein